VARTAAKIRCIALTALQETMRRRVFYVVVILVVIVAAVMVGSMGFLRMARESGEKEIVSTITAGYVQNFLGIWQAATMFLAVFLGAVGISSEVTAKTLVNILSRPVDRAAYLTGRWLGTVIFLWAFQILGMLLALLLTRVFDVHFVSSLWFGFVNMFVDSLFLSGVSLGLSVVMPPILAGGFSIFLQILPGIAKNSTQHPRWILRGLANAAYYLSPATMPVDLIEESFTKELLHPNYGLYSRVLAENMLYAIAVFVLACAVFARREVRFR